MGLLLDVSERHATSITVLSGEIHLGALGRIERNGIRLLQLTSSGIVHPPPMRPVIWAFELFSRGTVSVDAATWLNMLPLPGLGKRYLAARNWLSLDCNPDGSMRVKWHVEGNSGDFSMTIVMMFTSTRVHLMIDLILAFAYLWPKTTGYIG